jgi:hypothetical protein
LTPNGFAEKALIAQRFLQRKTVVYDQLKAEIESLNVEVHTLNEELTA